MSERQPEGQEMHAKFKSFSVQEERQTSWHMAANC